MSELGQPHLDEATTTDTAQRTGAARTLTRVAGLAEVLEIAGIARRGDVLLIRVDTDDIEPFVAIGELFAQREILAVFLDRDVTAEVHSEQTALGSLAATIRDLQAQVDERAGSAA